MSLKTFFILSACLVIFAIIRALKSDTPIPWTVPPKWRPLLAVLLGQIGAGIAALVKMKWPNLPIDMGDIFEAGIEGSAASALLNGLLGTKEAISQRVPPVVKSNPPPAMPPPLPIIMLLISSILLLGCAGSSASSPARETARATVLLVAEGVHAADVACAEVVKAGHPEVGKRCVDAYAVAQPSLVAAGEAVDTWDAASAGKVGCAVARAVDALRSMQFSIEGGGGKIPPAITDALTFASGLGAIACKGAS